MADAGTLLAPVARGAAAQAGPVLPDLAWTSPAAAPPHTRLLQERPACAVCAGGAGALEPSAAPSKVVLQAGLLCVLHAGALGALCAGALCALGAGAARKLGASHVAAPGVLRTGALAAPQIGSL